MPTLAFTTSDYDQLEEVVTKAYRLLDRHDHMYVGLSGTGRFVCHHNCRTMQDGDNAITLAYIARRGALRMTQAAIADDHLIGRITQIINRLNREEPCPAPV